MNGRSWHGAGILKRRLAGQVFFRLPNEKNASNPKRKSFDTVLSNLNSQILYPKAYLTRSFSLVILPRPVEISISSVACVGSNWLVGEEKE
jgi:hypothetical protein